MLPPNALKYHTCICMSCMIGMFCMICMSCIEADYVHHRCYLEYDNVLADATILSGFVYVVCLLEKLFENAGWIFFDGDVTAADVQPPSIN